MMNKKNKPKDSNFIYESVCIMGAGFSGLLDAAAIAPYSKKVIVIDAGQDLVKFPQAHRDRIPQDHHTHCLLGKGVKNIEHLLPGFTDLAIKNGAKICNRGTGLYIRTDEGKALDFYDSNIFFGANRNMFDKAIIKLLTTQHENVCILWDTTVTKYSIDDKNNLSIETNNNEKITSDLFIDCMGRRSISINQFKELYKVAPEVKRTIINSTYYTFNFNLSPSTPKNLVGLHALCSKENYIGASMVITDVDFTCSLHAYHDKIKLETGCFEEWLEKLSNVEDKIFFNICKEASPTHEKVKKFRIDDIHIINWPKYKQLPNNILFSGDSIGALDPIFIQGMTKSTHDAVQLRQYLQRHGTVNCKKINLTNYRFCNFLYILDSSYIAKFKETNGSLPFFSNTILNFIKLNHKFITMNSLYARDFICVGNFEKSWFSLISINTFKTLLQYLYQRVKNAT